MRPTPENAEADTTQRKYARLAGFLFLAEIILALGSGFVLSHIAGSGTFAETTKRVAAEGLYRAALSTVVIVTLSSAVLGFVLYALYATLKAVNRLLAQLGMSFWLGDSFLVLMVRMCGFVRLHLYISAQIAGIGGAQLKHWRT